jgi:hypothetical protein
MSLTWHSAATNAKLAVARVTAFKTSTISADFVESLRDSYIPHNANIAWLASSATPKMAQSDNFTRTDKSPASEIPLPAEIIQTEARVKDNMINPTSNNFCALTMSRRFVSFTEVSSLAD